MAIISRNKPRDILHYGYTQFRYAIVYVFVTLIVLVFLNVYTYSTSRTLFYQSKEESMIEKAQFASSEIEDLDILSPEAVQTSVEQLESLRVTRLIVTDKAGVGLYDSMDDAFTGGYVLLPEIIQALDGNDVFSWHYQSGTMKSQAATPIFKNGLLTGCVYIMEYDTSQGALISRLHSNIFSVTLALETLVILFSISFALGFSKRVRRISNSLRIIRDGDYSHKINMNGHDELTTLGDEFDDLTARLHESERKRRQFVSDASHELKTPLASIKLLSDSILQNSMDAETVREFVLDINREADRLTRMSEKLLSLNRVDLQKQEEAGTQRVVSYMAPTISRVVRMLGAIAESNGVSINTDLAEDCPIPVPEDDLYQIAFNLVENGIKYNRVGGSLTISLRRNGSKALLRVQDTGVGIPADSVPHIFERFYRVDKARSRQTGGSGLGLAIVRDVVNNNGGAISLKSTPGLGSVFTVAFPICPEQEAAEVRKP